MLTPTPQLINTMYTWALVFGEKTTGTEESGVKSVTSLKHWCWVWMFATGEINPTTGF